MKIRKTLRGSAEPNLSSSADISFLLIIFFMVTSAFIFKDGLHIVLPNKSKKPKVLDKKEDNKLATIAIAADDNITLNKKKITVPELEAQLKDILQKEAETIVLLKVAPDVTYAKMLEVIDVVKFLKAPKFSLKMLK